MQPDLTGFADAQVRLIDEMGQSVTWVITGSATYPSGTALDPETGRPFDPRIDPITTGETQVTFKAAIVAQPLAGDRVGETAIGLLRAGEVAALIKVSDRPKIENATSAIVMGRTYAVKDIVEDGIEKVTRYVVILEPRT